MQNVQNSIEFSLDVLFVKFCTLEKLGSAFERKTKKHNNDRRRMENKMPAKKKRGGNLV